MEFYPDDKIIFASDCPFDPEKGTLYIRETLKILDSLNIPRPSARRSTTGRWRRLAA
jgi:uncharacterized protein